MKNSAIFVLVFVSIAYIVFLLRPFYIGSTLTNFKPIFDFDTLEVNDTLYGSIFKNGNSKNLDTTIKEIEIIASDSMFYSDINIVDRITDSLIKYYDKDLNNALYKFSLILNDNNSLLKIKSFSTFSLDTVFFCYNWVSQFKFLAKINNNKKSFFFNAVYDFWMLEIVKSLEENVKRSPELKYSAKYRILQSLCETNKYNPSINMSWVEKVLYNVENSRFDYIIGRFYLVFGYWGIILFSIFTVTTFSAYTVLLKLIFFKLNIIRNANK